MRSQPGGISGILRMSDRRRLDFLLKVNSIFNDTVLALLEAVPGLRRDPDLGAANQGVTVLWLK
jgi:hypothetical protein